MTKAARKLVCAVAIVKGETQFIEEWLVYHLLIGVDHFVIFDNDPDLPLRPLLAPYGPCVTVIDWPNDPTANWKGRNRQTRTYWHALQMVRPNFEWVAFLDVDEFIVLRRHDSIAQFLSSLGDCGSVRLNWHVFGHNGYYEDPEGLVTAKLTRRMSSYSPRTKAISRTDAVEAIESAHVSRLKPGWRTVDANGRRYSDSPAPDRTRVAHINHYQCRSFLNWMARVQRGDVSFDRSNVPAEHAWRLDEHLCLRQFVEVIARDKNEQIDDYMVRFEEAILSRMAAMAGEKQAGKSPSTQATAHPLALHGSPVRMSEPPAGRQLSLAGLLRRILGRVRTWSVWRVLRRE